MHARLGFDTVWGLSLTRAFVLPNAILAGTYPTIRKARASTDTKDDARAVIYRQQRQPDRALGKRQEEHPGGGNQTGSSAGKQGVEYSERTTVNVSHGETSFQFLRR